MRQHHKLGWISTPRGSARLYVQLIQSVLSALRPFTLSSLDGDGNENVTKQYENMAVCVRACGVINLNLGLRRSLQNKNVKWPYSKFNLSLLWRLLGQSKQSEPSPGSRGQLSESVESEERKFERIRDAWKGDLGTNISPYSHSLSRRFLAISSLKKPLRRRKKFNVEHENATANVSFFC